MTQRLRLTITKIRRQVTLSEDVDSFSDKRRIDSEIGPDPDVPDLNSIWADHDGLDLSKDETN